MTTSQQNFEKIGKAADSGKSQDDMLMVINGLKNHLPVVQSNSRNKNCLFDHVYTAACYAYLSYVFSRLHSDTLASINHCDTHKLVCHHQNDVVVVYNNEENPQIGAVIIPLEEEITIIFHGINADRKTDNLINFESRLVSTTYAPGLYHEGFLSLAFAIIPEIVKVLRKKYGTNYTASRKFNIYGHSMGGAIAQLLTQYLQHRYLGIDIETIVFGSPKLMCPIAVNAYNEKNCLRTLRVENPLDFAIYMPTATMGYSTVAGQLILPNILDISRTHNIRGYLDILSVLRQQFRQHGIEIVSLDVYTTVMTKLNLYPWLPSLTEQPSVSAVSEFIQYLGHSLMKGIQNIIPILP